MRMEVENKATRKKAMLVAGIDADGDQCHPLSLENDHINPLFPAIPKVTTVDLPKFRGT